jgi:hypothetical protein
MRENEGAREISLIDRGLDFILSLLFTAEAQRFRRVSRRVPPFRLFRYFRVFRNLKKTLRFLCAISTSLR